MAVGAQDPAWQTSAEVRFVSVRTAPTGAVVGITADGMIGLDPANGQQLWLLSNLGSDLQNTFHVVGGSPLGLVLTDRDATLVDLEDGSVRWTLSATVPEPEDYGFLGRPDPSALVFAARQKDRTVRLTVVDAIGGQVLMDRPLSPGRSEFAVVGAPQPGTLVVYQRGGAGEYLLSATSWFPGGPDWTRSDLLARPVKTGSIGLWKATALRSLQEAKVHVPSVDGGLGLQPEGATNVVVDENRWYLFLGDDGVVCVDAMTGARIWHQPSVKSGRGAAVMRLADSVLVVDLLDRVYALASNDGAVLWRRGKPGESTVQLMVRPYGVVSASSFATDSWNLALALTDPATGEVRWELPRPISFGRGGQAPAPTFADPRLVVHEHTVLVAAAGALTEVDLRTGAARTVAPIRLLGSELPDRLQTLDGGLFLQSSQNALFIDSAGVVKHHSYYPPVREAFLGRALRHLVAATYATALAQQHSEAARNPMLAAAPSSLPASYLDDRYYRAGIERDRYAFVYTDQPAAGRKGGSLVKVDKVSGAEVGRAWLNQRTPEMAVHADGSAVYVVQQGRVVAYRFETGR
jgi:outer membrane protein assembly factor BamB